MKTLNFLLLIICGSIVASCLLASGQELPSSSPQNVVAVPTNSSAGGNTQESAEEHDHEHSVIQPSSGTGEAISSTIEEDHDHDHDHEHEHEHEHAGEESSGAPVDEHDHADEEHDHAGEEHDHAGEEHDHADEEHDHADEEHDHADEEHDHADEEHDHAGEEHDHDHDHTEGVDASQNGTVSGDAVCDCDHAHAEEDDPHAGHLHGGGSCEFSPAQNYNLGLRIGSVFILLGVSLLGAFLPVLLHVSSKRTFILVIVRLGTYFGFGTILATAFIHTMIPAAQKLNSDCLSDSWNEAYEGWGYLFVVISILLMQLIDYCVEMAYHHFSKTGAISEGDLHGAITHMHGHAHERQSELSGAVVLPANKLDSVISSGSSEEGVPQDEEAGNCPQHGEGCTTLLAHKADPSQIVGIYMMEAGIVFHSVIIGLALGVTEGTSFNTLLIAISFHQFFEGFAIGSAAVDSGMGWLKASILAAVYSITTPIGIAIGIGVRESFHTNSTKALYVEGILDAFATGILVYVVLVELLNPMMTQSKWLRSRPWWLQMLAFASLYAGAAVMAVLGKWV